MEPPGAETQALKAFFNDELDNDSVCGTEDSEDASKRTSDGGKRVSATFSMIAETQSPVKPVEQSPRMPPEETESISKDCAEKQRAMKPLSALGLEIVKRPVLELCGLSDGQGGDTAAVDDGVGGSRADDGKGQALPTPQFNHSAMPEDRTVTPTAASASAALIGSGSVSSLRASSGERERADISAEQFTNDQPQFIPSMLHTQIEAQVHVLTDSSAVAKPSEHASIPDTQLELYDPKLTMEFRATDVPLQDDTQIEAPVSAVKGHGGAPADEPGDNPEMPLIAKESNTMDKGVGPAGGSDVLSPADAVTPDLLALVTGSNPPSTTGTVIPESVRPGTAIPEGTQHTLLLPEEAALPFPNESASVRRRRASCGSMVADNRSPGDASLPVGVSAAVDVPKVRGACVGEVAELDNVGEQAAAVSTDCATPIGLGAEGANVPTVDHHTDTTAGKSSAVAAEGGDGAAEQASLADGAGSGHCEHGDAPRNDSERLNSAVLRNEEPVGDVQGEADVVGDSPASRCSAGASPDTCVGAPPDTSGSKAEVQKKVEEDARPQGISADGKATHDVDEHHDPAADSHMQECEEEEQGAPAAANSELHASPPNLDDSQMLLMMTQPADTVDMMAVNGGIFDLAKQLCGDLAGTTPSARPKASAEKSGLAVATKDSLGLCASVCAAAANSAGPGVQSASECHINDAVPNVHGDVDEAEENEFQPPPESATAALPCGKDAQEHGGMQDDIVKQQPIPSGAGSDNDAVEPQRPVRSKRKRPQRLRDIPSPQQSSRRSSSLAQVEAKAIAENEQEAAAQPGRSQEEAAPDPELTPCTDALQSLEQKLSTGAPGTAPAEQHPSKRSARVKKPAAAGGTGAVARGLRPERASRKRSASEAKQPAQGGQEAQDEDMESVPPAEAQNGPAPRAKRRKKEQKAAAIPPKPKPRAPVKAARKAPVRKGARTAPKRGEEAEPAADPSYRAAAAAAAPAPSWPGRRRRTPVSAATPERDAPVPGTPSRRSSARAPSATHLLSPIRDRAVSLPRKLANKAKSAGIQIREHRAGEKVSEFTHFVADELVLSLHTLVALAAGRPIVTSAWLHQSIDGGVALPVGSLLLEDFQAEKKHKFILKSSYDAARSRKLLHGCVCCVSDSLIQAEADDGEGLKLVIKAALGTDGQFLEGTDALTGYLRAQGSDDSKRVLLLVEAGADKRSLRSTLPKGVQVWTRPQFVQAVVQQTFSHQHAFLQT